jgi:hypothetical protein
MSSSIPVVILGQALFHHYISCNIFLWAKTAVTVVQSNAWRKKNWGTSEELYNIGMPEATFIETVDGTHVLNWYNTT